MSERTRGLQEILSNLDVAKLEMFATTAGAAFTAGQHVLTQSNQMVPHQDGVLERSGRVTLEERGDESVAARIGYSTPYAARQHEDLTLRHDEGRQAKFLETALNRERGTVEAIIAEQMRGALR